MTRMLQTFSQCPSNQHPDLYLNASRGSSQNSHTQSPILLRRVQWLLVYESVYPHTQYRWYQWWIFLLSDGWMSKPWNSDLTKGHELELPIKTQSWLIHRDRGAVILQEEHKSCPQHPYYEPNLNLEIEIWNIKLREMEQFPMLLMRMSILNCLQVLESPIVAQPWEWGT